MEKTQVIINEIENFKRNLNIKNYGYFIKYGSFYRYEKKYVNDIDISFLTYNELNIDIIRNILIKLEEVKHIIKLNIYCGHPNINNYNDKNYYKKLYDNNLISKNKYNNIISILKNNNDLLKKYVNNNIELEWTMDDINNGYLMFNDIKYNLNEILKNNIFWCDIIYEFNNLLLPIEFIIMPKYQFKSNKQNEIYYGCKLAIYEFKTKNYYNFIKRLKSCYVVNLKRNILMDPENIKYIDNTFNQLKKIISDNEKLLSTYNMLVTKYKLKDNYDNINKITEDLNKKFIKTAIRYYNEGVEKNILY